jgi:hypothetical protein
LPKARVFPYEVLETEVANALKQTEESDQTPPEDAYDGDGGYEFQYWFRRPVIRVIHYDEKFSGGGFGSPPDPYEPNPLGVDKNDDVKQQQKEDSGAEDDGGKWSYYEKLDNYRSYN